MDASTELPGKTFFHADLAPSIRHAPVAGAYFMTLRVIAKRYNVCHMLGATPDGIRDAQKDGKSCPRHAGLAGGRWRASLWRGAGW